MAIATFLLASVVGACGSEVVQSINVSQNSGQSLGVRIATDSQGGRHVVWHDDTEGHDNIYYAARSPDGEWSQSVNLSHSEVYARQPSLAIDSEDTLHVVWHGTLESSMKSDIFYTSKSKGGDWTQPVNLSQSEHPSDAAWLHVDAAGTLHLVYNEETDTDADVFYMFRPKDGDWSARTNITDDESRSSELSLASDKKGGLYFAWSAEHEENWEIFYKRRDPDGQWSAPFNLSNNEGESRSLMLDVDSHNNVHIFWHDDTASNGTWDLLYLSVSPDWEWQPLVNLTEDTNGTAGFPYLAIDGENRLHLAFNYQWPSGARNYDILYRTKAEGGRWARAVNVSHSDSQSGDPAIALDGGWEVYIAYSDQAPGNWDVFVAQLQR